MQSMVFHHLIMGQICNIGVLIVTTQYTLEPLVMNILNLRHIKPPY